MRRAPASAARCRASSAAWLLASFAPVWDRVWIAATVIMLSRPGSRASLPIFALLFVPERTARPALVQRADRLAVEHHPGELPTVRLPAVSVGIPARDHHRPRALVGRDRARLEEIPRARGRVAVVRDLDDRRDHVVERPGALAGDAGE